MLRENDRVRFVDVKMDKQFGVLIIFNIKGGIATIGKSDYASLGQNMINVKLSEIKLAE